MSKHNLKPYLDYQADRIEAVLATHKVPGRVTGGTVGPRQILFNLDPAPQVRVNAIKHLAEDLALALRVAHLRVDRGSAGIVLSFANPEPREVRLLDIIPQVVPVPVSAAVLGLTEKGVPLLARLASPEVGHILVAGTTGSGKSVLLRTLAASLVLTHQARALRLVCIDPKGWTFRSLVGTRHLQRKPVSEAREVIEVLRSLLRTMEIRDRRAETAGSNTGNPRIVVLVDELADLVMYGGHDVLDMLARLVQRGREAGIHIVGATQYPSSAILSAVVRANFPLRLVGKTTSAQDARVASGRAGTGAHLLDGRGDFLAVNGGADPLRFQVATISEKEVRRGIVEQRLPLLKALPRVG
ncbi:MAG: DNA translocase FtsK [Anaerolineae bacterium]|nr:DNA translocase FtsK [Anaerolineae bacterium]